MSRPPLRALLQGVAIVAAGLLLPPDLTGQVEIRDLVFTGGSAMEWYRGNLATVTLPVVDSAESVGAVVGQVSGTLDLRLLSRSNKTLDLTVDSGLRQFVTWGWNSRRSLSTSSPATGA